MGTPKKIPSYLTSEFEESEVTLNEERDRVLEVQQQDVLLKEMTGLKEIQKCLYQWGSAQFEKKNSKSRL